MRASEDILSRSPLDRIPIKVEGLPASVTAKSVASPLQHWKPSRFNVQTTTTEGWLLLWNSYTGSMNAFRPSQREAVLSLISQKGVTAASGGVTGYLAERGYLVPRDADELRRVQYEFGQENHRTDKLELILLASEDCNFRCSYCYEDFRHGTMRPEVRDGIKRLVESRIDALRALKVGWFGGEPLYGMDAIEDLAPFFAETAKRARLEYFSHMTTNGYLLTSDVADRLLSWGIRDFQITLDGLPEDHDRHRTGRDGSGTFQCIFDNLVNLSERSDDFTVVIRVNFDQSNAPGLEQFLGMLQEKFSADARFNLSFHAIGRWGGANDPNLAVCGIDEAESVRMKMKAAARSLGLNVISGWHPAEGVGTQVCYAARPYNFIVGATGELMKCTIDLDKKDHNIVGRLLPDGRLQLDKDKMALWTEPAFERDSGCQSCHMLPACQGIHCPKIRIDQGRRPCPSVRRTAKLEMVDYFRAKQGAAEGVRGEQHAVAEEIVPPAHHRWNADQGRRT